MTLLARSFAIMLFALAVQPAMGHGPDKHEETTAVSAQASASDPAGPPALDQRSENSGEEDRDARSGFGSILTRLHPATVHFPIALLLMAALTELIAIARPSAGLFGGVRVMVWGGAVGAIVAAGFGWAHTGLWLGGDTTMQWHRWTGTTLAIAAPVAALLSFRENRLAFRVLLFAIAATLFAQGYWGGELAHGPGHLGI